MLFIPTLLTAARLRTLADLHPRQSYPPRSGGEINGCIRLFVIARSPGQGRALICIPPADRRHLEEAHMAVRISSLPTVLSPTPPGPPSVHPRSNLGMSACRGPAAPAYRVCCTIRGWEAAGRTDPVRRHDRCLVGDEFGEGPDTAVGHGAALAIRRCAFLQEAVKEGCHLPEIAVFLELRCDVVEQVGHYVAARREPFSGSISVLSRPCRAACQLPAFSNSGAHCGCGAPAFSCRMAVATSARTMPASMTALSAAS